MNNDALKYDVNETSGNPKYQLVWRDSEGKIGDVIAGGGRGTKSLFKHVARGLNRHTRDDEILVTGTNYGHDQIIREIMAERGLTYHDAVQEIFATGATVESGTGGFGFDYCVEHADFPGQTIHLSFERVDNLTDEDVHITVKGEDGDSVYSRAFPLNWIVDQVFKEIDPEWQSVAQKNATDHSVFIQFGKPENGFQEALGEIGRKHSGAGSAGGNCCTWTFDTEEKAMDYMAEAAPVAARYSGDGSFGIDYTKA
jgi:hypothetical protein